MSRQTQWYTKDEVVIEPIVSKHIKDLTGQKFNRWNVIGFAGLNKEFKATWWCWCDCNPAKYYILVGSEISMNRSKSCGCLIAEENMTRSTLWKDAYRYNVDKKTIQRLHRIFNSMKDRCYNMLSKDFPVYGKRGIKICDEWLLNIDSFVEWAITNGYEDHLSIDRKDVNGNYEPNNCRWITLEAQARNKTTTIYVEYNGEKRPLLSVLEENGIRNNYHVYRERLVKRKWDIEKVIHEPIRTEHKKESFDKVLYYFNNNNVDKINIREFCNNNEINLNTFRFYLQDESFMHMLNQNHIYRKEKGFLTYEPNTQN